VALMAPIVGLMAESIGRKKVIVPSLYALTVPTLLAATSQSLHALIFWRFMQGRFVPGMIVVMMAYINEEFASSYVGRAMSAYVTRTVLGGFLGRYISGWVAHHFDWRGSFLAIGILNLAGAVVVQRALPKAKNFVRSLGWRHSIADGCELLSRRSTVPSQFRATGQRVLRLPAGSACYAAVRTISGPLWHPAHRAAGVRLRTGWAYPHVAS